MGRSSSLVTAIFVSVVFACVLAALAFPLIYQHGHPQTLPRSRCAVKELSQMECKSVTKIVLEWRRTHPGEKRWVYTRIELTRGKPSDLQDIRLLCQSLKAMSVDETERKDIARGDRLIIYSRRNPHGYGVYFLGFDNPPPFIGPTLRSSTLGPLLQQICRERTKG